MNSPLVSVIVPVYNVEKYLEKCLDSITRQTYENLEIILVDDGSTDDSGRMIDEYKKGTKDKRIRIIHKKNGGLSSARNAGLELMKGEWVVFVDSDDYISRDFVETLYNLAIKNNAEIATCSFESFSDDGSILKKSPSWPNGVMSGTEAINDMFANKRPAYICLSMFRAELFVKNDILFPEGREFEDIATRVKLLYFAKKVAFSNKRLYSYLIRGGSITGKKFSKTRYDDFLMALNDVEDFLRGAHNKMLLKYLDYFNFYSLFTLLNYLAKEQTITENTKKYWGDIRGRLKRIYKVTVFPSIKARILYRVALLLSANRKLYSLLYRKGKEINE